MNSSTSRDRDEQTRQAEIRQQIALLQAQLNNTEKITVQPVIPVSPKRKRDLNVLVPPTPSPKKRRKTVDTRSGSPSRRPKPIKQVQPSRPNVAKPSPSTLLSKMADITQPKEEKNSDNITRSFAFSDVPAQPTVQRDERLAIIEELEPGPVEYTPPVDDPEFKQLEPNSGIRLSSRSLTHEDLQNHLTGRYYLSPSRLYSCIRLHPNKQSYDVPVCGDWITIAVVAERGPVKFSRAPVTVEKLPEEEDGEKKHFKKAKTTKPRPPVGKKYVNVKLVDFGARSKSSGHGGKSVIRGDAFLTLLLFESDGFDIIKEDNGREKKIYKGGSKGAFESMSKLKEGDVIAMLNPKVLKPFQSANDKPHPVTNVLAVTPESASSIVIIGRSRDLGMCVATKKDGKICGSWCDKRISDICEWHMQNAVKSRRATRAEFAIGTSGMSNNTATNKRKAPYDPARQWGLKPEGSNARAREEDGGGSTYVLSGHVVNSSTMYMAESMGREAQARATRKKKDTEEEIQELLKRDKGGILAKGNSRILKGKAKEDSEQEEEATAKSMYSASMIKHLGFDPAVKAGFARPTNLDVQRKKQEIESILASRKSVQLGPRPGKSYTSVRAPPKTANSDNDTTTISNEPAEGPAMIDLDED